MNIEIRIKHGFISLAIIFLALSSINAQNQTAKVTPQGVWYYEYLPPDYNSNTNNYPIVFFFHGMGERGNLEADLPKVAYNGPPKHVKNGYKFPFILISPQLKTTQAGWYQPYMDGVVNHVKSYLRIDLDRVYITGLSLGGGGAWVYAGNRANEIAAVAPVCGSNNSYSLVCNFANANLPVWAFHGDADTTVPLSRTTGYVNAINNCVPAPNPLAMVTVYAGVGHNSWDRAYRTDNSLHTPNVYEWMMGFTRNGITVNAGPDVTLNLPTNSTTLTGTASTTSGTITSYAWTKVSGPVVTITNASSNIVSLSDMVTGIYNFRLTVTNSLGKTKSDDVVVSIVSGNQNPTANAGTDKTITLPTNSLNLVGSGSDPDGSITTYSWTKVSGPTATLVGQNTSTLSLSNLLQGTYVFSLSVTDNNGSTATDNVTVIVNAAAINQNPVANAGVDKSLNLPTNSTTLTGSGSDPDGSIATYLWVKVSGPAATLTNANTATLSLSGLVAGSYVFRLTVTDNLGATANDQATITVIAANQSPVANAGSAITITLPTNSTNIIGSGSDADGSIATYAWTQVSGPNTATLTNSASTTVTTSNLVQGVYTFRLTVTDNLGATGFSNVTVTVNAAPVNVAPAANAGADQSITLPINSVVIVGSGNDSDGSIASYNWTLFSGPAATLAGQTTTTLTASNLVAGTYVFRLTVTDNQGATGFDNINITVQPAAVNQSPLVDVGPDFSLTLPTNSTTISANASDPDGTISTYLWTKISGPTATLGGTNTSTLSVSAMVAGTYIFRLTVADNIGATASDDISVIVASGNQPPVVVASNDETLTLPASSTNLIAVASDPDGTISSYLWANLSGPAAPTMGGTATSSLSISGLIAGTYVFRILVTDNNGATAFDNVTVIVQSATNISPSATAGVDKSITLPTNSTNFTGSGSDPDGTITNYLWTQISGTGLTLANSNTTTLTVSGATAGTYTFRLTVTDNNGATGIDDVTLTVNPAAVNQSPVANAGSNQSISLPQNTLNLSGTGSDPDGTLASYQWIKISGPSATLTNDNNPTVSLSGLVEGTYIFRLTVTDNNGATGFDEITVFVLPSAVNQMPIANAGTDITLTLPSNSTTVFGNATDVDGSIASYSWTKLSGPTATLTNTTIPTLSLSNLLQGVYVFRLTVTDNIGGTDNDDVTVTVNAVATNQLPVANAGTDKIIVLPTSSTNLSGSGSDADGSITTYAWLKVSGPTVTLGSINLPTITISNLIEGTYVFRLEVTDNNGAVDTDDVIITVNPATINQSPIVNAGPDKTIFLPVNTVQFSGSTSDPDGSIATQGWTQVSGPSTATLLNANSTLLTVNNLFEGIYIFRFSATDDQSSSAFDEVQVTVNSATVNQPPAVTAGLDVTIKLPINNITLTASTTDIDGTITSHSWIKLSGPSCILANASTSELSVTNMLEGTYIFRITVTDNNGATATDDITVIVQSATLNTPPQANAGSDRNILLPINTTTISGSASDDGAIITTAWTQLSGPAVTLTGTNTSVLTLNNLVEGTYVFRFTITDDGGLSDDDDVMVTVFPEAPTSLPPVVSAGDDQMIQLPINSITVTASADDPDGIINSYKWTQSFGAPVTISPDDSTILKLENLLPGTYSFVVTVIDVDNLTASDEVTIIVREEDPIVKPFNTFSPDGKGEVKTETWHMDNTDLISDCEVVVYNRQGLKVFESIGYPTEWDGTFNGKLLPEDVYFYVIKCPGKNTINGSVTIIR